MQTVGVKVDEQGMCPDALAMVLSKGVQAILVTPRAHNPTGCSLSKQRAKELKLLLAEYPNVLIIVDDHFALLAESPYHSIIPTEATRWALIRSVSKGLGPDLRLAFVACDPATAVLLRTRLAPGMTWISHILQSIVAACLKSDDVNKLLSMARCEYGRLRDELRIALQTEGIDVAPVSDGLNIWLPLSKDAKDVSYELAKKGWLVRIGNAFEVQNPAQAIRITVSKMQDGVAQHFAADLKSCLTR